ncbi:MAG: FlgD immunoglobulin-like domain containing protein [Victivallales bacterium]
MKLEFRRMLGMALVIFAMIASGAVMATQTETRGAHAVPAPKPVVVDGSLDEWDLSGQYLQCYDVETLKDVYSGSLAFMYDADNLYISIHWMDPIPMGNSHDPRFQASKGWAGDCVQFRIKTDRISHVTAWYYAAKQEPTIQIECGKSLTEPFGGGGKVLLGSEGSTKLTEGSEMAFRKDADGKGYVQEMKLPWKLITLEKQFKAGDKINVGVELLWGEADWPVHRYADNLMEGTSSREFFWTALNSWGEVILEEKGNLKLPEPSWKKATAAEEATGPVDISYDLPKDARVTLAVDDKDGKRVRNLIAAASRKAGRNVEKWDGLDDEGKPVPAGDYKFKAIYHDGIHVNYVMSFANPGNPTWDTSDGRGAFYGDHTAPHAAAAAGDYVALACPMGEGGRYLIGLNLDGQKLWGLSNRVFADGNRASLATDGKILWIANQGRDSSIYRVEIATGKYAPWKRIVKDPAGNDTGLLDLVVSDFKKEQGKGTLPVGIGGEGRKPLINMTAIAYHDGKLAVCLNLEDAVKILDSETGDVKSELKVKAPVAAAFAGSSWIVLSEGKLLRMGTDGKTANFADGAFADGYGLATDAEGKVYLSVRGKEQNVKVFSPEGKLLREIGKRGGRPNNGAFIADAMREPGQISVDSKNRLWVTEETMNPKRTSVWDAGSGKLVKDLVGTATYSGTGAINPFDSTMAFSNDTVYRIDLGKGTWEPVYSVAASEDPADIFPVRIHNYVTSKMVSRDGKLYGFNGGSARGASAVACVLWDGKAWKSVANVGIVPKVNRPEDLKEEWVRFKNELFAGKGGQLYAWVDKDGDGLVQKDELSFNTASIDGKPVELSSYYWGQLPDNDGTLTYLAKSANALVRVPITGINSAGAPVYDVSKLQIVKADQPVIGKGNGEGMIIGGDNGRVYLNQDPLVAVEKDGHVIGGYPNRHTSVHGSHTAKASRPGYLIGPSSFLGTANLGGDIGEVFDLNGNLGENYLFTNDGLWIQALFKDTRGGFEIPSVAVKGMSMDAISAGGESFGGNFIKASDGKIYLIIGGTDARVLEVKGLDTLKRLAGQFTYTPAQYAEAQKLLQEKSIQSGQAKVYQVARAKAPVAIDGKSDKWPELMDDGRTLLEIQENKQKRYGRVQARYDADNLYLAYRVFAPRSQMKNVGQDYRLLFKSGDVVDLMVGAEPQKAKGEGNTRIVMTVKDGKLAAVLNQKFVPGAAKGEGFGFASPARTIPFDRVVMAPDVKLAASAVKGGYFVEAAIPWKLLGIVPKSGLRLKADFGVLFADDGGTITVSRQYWSNKETNLVNDIPGEADLAPDRWGMITLE